MTKDDVFFVLPPALLVLFQIGRALLDAFFNVLWRLW